MCVFCFLTSIWDKNLQSGEIRAGRSITACDFTMIIQLVFNRLNEKIQKILLLTVTFADIIKSDKTKVGRNSYQLMVECELALHFEQKFSIIIKLNVCIAFWFRKFTSGCIIWRNSYTWTWSNNLKCA